MLLQKIPSLAVEFLDIPLRPDELQPEAHEGRVIRANKSNLSTDFSVLDQLGKECRSLQWKRPM